ncbi:beta-mannosidase [Halobacillus andaensis]|uniref:beta-mannosidase n=1 Tax=Halobacillus andaensis TaxID=1176239 RepID=UPI003D7313BC
MKLQEWKIQWFGPGEKNPLEISSPYYIDHFWMTTRVPGDIHSTLISKKLIPDPFVGHMDLECRWVEEKEWWYRTSFYWDECLDPLDTLELLFEGIDTYATVYLNGKEIGSTANMLVEHSFDVTREMKNGNNVIAVKIDPVHSHVKHKEQGYWCSYGKERIWTRKAAMNFGWDWGPRLVTGGLWKGVHVLKKAKANIDSVFPRTMALNDSSAIVEVDIGVKQHFKCKQKLNLEVELASKYHTFKSKTQIVAGKGRAELHVFDPVLWWTHDLGEPHLYDLTVSLRDSENHILDEKNQKFGIREVKVEQTHENGDHLFAFNLNGVRLFAKGANWIPVHSFIGSIDDRRYTKQLEMGKAAHMNMMRVWGGGIYEKEVFYEECDRLGMLVWQDFMFANALYPDYNKDFQANVEDEIEKVIKRLRPHTCLALWCGNNEIDWIFDRKSSDGEITTPFYGEKIYHQWIPQKLERLDDTRLYWPSSPFGSTGNTDLDAEEVGDRHNWVVWHGNVEPRKKGEPVIQNITKEGVSFKNYKKDATLFSSEFGMHASSNRYTLSKYIPKKEFYWKSEEMAYRNKDHFHEKGILLMEDFTGAPGDIEEYMNYSMLTQAEGLKYGIEHYRRRKPWTSGALIWQLNDCWPGTSWSMIDYELLPKASYYYAKKFFDPVLATIDHEPGELLNIYLVNDRLQRISGDVGIEVRTFKGDIVCTQTIAYEVDGNMAKQVSSIPEADLLQGADPTEVVIRLYSYEGAFQDNVYYLRDFKDLRLPKANLKVEYNLERRQITVTSDLLARFVKLEMPEGEILCSDNFFDLLPEQSKIVDLHHLDGGTVDLENIQVSSLNSDSFFTIHPINL